MGSGAEKQTIKVGSKKSNHPVGETVAFTAEVLGTANFSGGADGGGWSTTYYRLPDGTFRALLETDTYALLFPSNMKEAIENGQRNNFSYGRWTLEEIKAESSFQIGEGFEKLMEVHPETVRNRVRDLD